MFIVLDDGETFGSVDGAVVIIPTPEETERLEAGEKARHMPQIRRIPMEYLIKLWEKEHGPL